MFSKVVSMQCLYMWESKYLSNNNKKKSEIGGGGIAIARWM